MEGVDAFDAAAFGVADKRDGPAAPPTFGDVDARAAKECTLPFEGTISTATGAGPWGGAFVGIADQAYQHAHIVPFWNQGGPGAPSPCTRTSPRVTP